MYNSDYLRKNTKKYRNLIEIIDIIIEQEKNHYFLLEQEFNHLSTTGYWYELDYLGG